MTKVKICGMTRLEDALWAETVGADAIGLIFAQTSKRRVDVATAQTIIQGLGIFTQTVGVFRNQDIHEVLDIAHLLKLDIVQLHGDENEAYILKVRESFPVIKALAVKDKLDNEHLNTLPADMLLIDSPLPGSGDVFDWSMVKDLSCLGNFILAGGLKPDNLLEAIEYFKPYGVDVASGVESSYGVKDKNKVQDFVSLAKCGLWTENLSTT
ncbi:MAG: phosphoribosylanthranilate isomerase [Deinococcales bacterium]